MHSCVNHRLNCKHMPCFHKTSCLVSTVVRDVWRTMEQVTNSMPAVGTIHCKSKLYYTVPVLFDVLRYHVSNLAIHSPRLADSDGFLQAFISFGDQKFARLSHISNQVSFIQVNVKPIFVDSYVEVDDIAILQGTIIRDSVANDLVDRSAEGFGELVIVQRRRVGIITNNEVMHSLANRVSCNSCLHKGMPEVQGLSGQEGNLANDSDILFAFYFDVLLQFGLLLLFGDRCEEVIWFGYMFWDCTFFGYIPWSERAGKLEAFISFLGLLLTRNMDKLMYSPALLKAILIAEIGRVEVHLFADRTKHGRWLAAPWCPALIIALHS